MMCLHVTHYPTRNLISPRSLIPAVKHTLTAVGKPISRTVEYTFVTAIFAVEAFAQVGPSGLQQMWDNTPQGHVNGDHIQLNS